MRVTVGIAILLAGCPGVSAQDASSGLRPTAGLSPLPSAPSTRPRMNEEALNRQLAMDRRMDSRTRRAIGSVCQGCGGGPQRRGSGGRMTDPDAGEAPIADPAEAPLD